MPRSIRHLLAATLAVMALAAGAVPAFGADEPVLTGTVVDAAGQPFPVEDGLAIQTAPDGGGIHAAQISVGGDGSFEVELMPWGTDGNPAEVTITITGAVSDTRENSAGCTDQFASVAEATFEVALEDGGQAEPVELVAQEQLIGTVCGAGGSPVVTLPPSQVDPTTAPASEPPAVVAPVTPAPTVPPAVAPVGDSGTMPWLPIALVAVVVAVLAVAGWRLMAGRSRA